MVRTVKFALFLDLITVLCRPQRGILTDLDNDQILCCAVHFVAIKKYDSELRNWPSRKTWLRGCTVTTRNRIPRRCSVDSWTKSNASLQSSTMWKVLQSKKPLLNLYICTLQMVYVHTLCNLRAVGRASVDSLMNSSICATKDVWVAEKYEIQIRSYWLEGLWLSIVWVKQIYAKYVL